MTEKFQGLEYVGTKLRWSEPRLERVIHLSHNYNTSVARRASNLYSRLTQEENRNGASLRRFRSLDAKNLHVNRKFLKSVLADSRLFDEAATLSAVETVMLMRAKLNNVHRPGRTAITRSHKAFCEALGFDDVYVECVSCSGHFTESDLTEVSGGDEVCDGCLSDHYVRCEDDEEYHLRRRAYQSPHSGDWFSSYYAWCESDDRAEYDAGADDDDDDDDDRNGLADYHSHSRRRTVVRAIPSDPQDVHAKQKAPIKLGFEWEVESDDKLRLSAWLDSNEYPALAERDGSIGDRYGVEVISGWSTLQTVCRWMTEIHANASPIGTSNCGLHVNISGLTPAQAVRYREFIDHSANKALVRHIAGRYDVDYAYRGSTPLADPKEKLKATRTLKHRGEYDEKYRHVNLARRGYIEVRVFASSTKLDTLLARLEFAWAAAEFVRSANIYTDLSAENFVQWFNSEPAVYKLCKNFARLSVGYGLRNPEVSAEQIARSIANSKARKAASKGGAVSESVKVPAAKLTDFQLAEIRKLPPLARARARRTLRASV